MSPLILSHFQTSLLLQARADGLPAVEVSPDLGLTRVRATLTAEGVSFPGGDLAPWPAVEEIDQAKNNCFTLSEGEPSKVMVFSDTTNRLVSLFPTTGAPTMLIGGIPMHRIKDTDPHRDTLEKLKSIKPLVGQVLDTHTGLGYTAIEAARTADHVLTVEIDPTVLQVARQNPWSQALFDNPRIGQRLGDCFDVVQELPDSSFDRIIHDPPAFALAGHVYGRDFYAELCRVLRRKGRLFHYIGNPDSPSGRSVTQGVVRRLKEAGFQRVAPQPRAFGVTASK